MAWGSLVQICCCLTNFDQFWPLVTCFVPLLASTLQFRHWNRTTSILRKQATIELHQHLRIPWCCFLLKQRLKTFQERHVHVSRITRSRGSSHSMRRFIQSAPGILRHLKTNLNQTSFIKWRSNLKTRDKTSHITHQKQLVVVGKPHNTDHPFRRGLVIQNCEGTMNGTFVWSAGTNLLSSNTFGIVVISIA